MVFVWLNCRAASWCLDLPEFDKTALGKPYSAEEWQEAFRSLAVASLRAFSDESEALRLANATPYGLAASVWTKDLDRAHRLVQRVEAGVIWINAWMVRDLRTPFGGAKQSGLGREGGIESVHFFQEPAGVTLRLGDPS